MRSRILPPCFFCYWGTPTHAQVDTFLAAVLVLALVGKDQDQIVRDEEKVQVSTAPATTLASSIYLCLRIGLDFIARLPLLGGVSCRGCELSGPTGTNSCRR